MKRNENNKIVAERLEKHEIINHDVTEDSISFEDTWNCVYEHVKVYTDANRPLIAFKFCECTFLTSYDKKDDQPFSRTHLLQNHDHVKPIHQIINKQFNAYQNCLGFCILDGDYWLNLTKENIDTALEDDQYEEVDENFTGDYLILYYNGESPIHIGRFNSIKHEFEHKMGCNSYAVRKTSNAPVVYKYDRIMRYRK